MIDAAVGLVRRQYRLIVLVTLTATVLGAAYLVATPFSFTATAKVIVDGRPAAQFQQQTAPNDPAIDTAAIQTQVEILRSEVAARKVIAALHLADEPEFNSPNLFLQ